MTTCEHDHSQFPSKDPVDVNPMDSTLIAVVASTLAGKALACVNLVTFHCVEKYY